MIRVLIVSVKYGKKSTGGAAKSFVNILQGLVKIQNINIKMYAKTSSKLIKKILDPSGFSYFLYLPLIIRAIKKFRPNVIITQSRIAFSATLAARISKVPIITLIRDVSDICPKYLDIIAYGKACNGLENRSICYQCINYWRSLRVLIGNKPRGWQYSFRALSSTIRYKIRYYASFLNLKILKLATIIIVASQLMKDILSNHIDSEKIKILNITPIRENAFTKPSTKKKQFLFIIPSGGAAHKGLDFILRFSKYIPEPFKVVIVGAILDSEMIAPLKDKIINIDYIEKSQLDRLYSESLITLVPSFWTEAFGRIIIESIVNKTPVITSPNCGANFFFSNKEYLKIVPLKLELWKKTVTNFIENTPIITDDDVREIYNLYSIEKSQEDLSKIINKVIIRPNESELK